MAFRRIRRTICGCSASAGQEIGKVDAKTGMVTIYKTPTQGSRPRRGRVDAQGRLWFGEYGANAIGMFDPKTETFKEWTVPTAWSAPYDVVIAANGDAWTGSMHSDRVSRLDPKTNQFVEYLMPRPTNIRRVFVDGANALWVGSNHGASIVKVEPLDRRPLRFGRERAATRGWPPFVRHHSCAIRPELGLKPHQGTATLRASRARRIPRTEPAPGQSIQTMKRKRPMTLRSALLASGDRRSVPVPRCRSSRSAQSALTGQVTSAEEGAMEGVVVSAKKDGSTISDQRRHRRAGPLRVPGRPARARPVHPEGARRRL